PEPSLTEQLEAAIGLCYMASKNDDNYQPDYAAHFLGQFLVDFTRKYEGDRQNAKEKQTESWQYHAARLKQAMKGMQAEHDGNNGGLPDEYSKYMLASLNQTPDLLNNIAAGKVANAQALNTWLGEKQPKSVIMYKKDDKSVVKPAAGE